MKPYGSHDSFLPYLLNRVTDLINVRFQAELRRRGMTLTHWRVLAFLNQVEGLGVSELADRTVTGQSTLSRALQQMEKQGLVERRTGTDDSRFVEIHLTQKGHGLFKEILPRALELSEQALAGLMDRDRDDLMNLLARVLLNLEPR